MITRFSLFFLIFLCSFFIVSAKNSTEKTSEHKSHLTYQQIKNKSSSVKDQTNPVKIVSVLLIRSYQYFFSSLDGSTCQFRPSCSHFGAEAIKKHGVLLGTLMTADRILRCNPFTRGKYPLTDDKRHHHDPVEEHVLCKD